MSTNVVLTAALLAALSGVPSLFRRPRPNGPSPETWLMGSAALLGLTGVVLAFLPGSRGAVEIPWGIAGGPFQAGVDPLSALFLGPLFLVSGAGAFYGDVYWSETLHPSWRRLRVFYGLLTGALTVVFVARNFLLFLGAVRGECDVHLCRGPAALAGMRVVDDDGEGSPAMPVADLVQNERELLHRGDDDLLALLQIGPQLLRSFGDRADDG